MAGKDSVGESNGRNSGNNNGAGFLRQSQVVLEGYSHKTEEIRASQVQENISRRRLLYSQLQTLLDIDDFEDLERDTLAAIASTSNTAGSMVKPTAAGGGGTISGHIEEYIDKVRNLEETRDNQLITLKLWEDYLVKTMQGEQDLKSQALDEQYSQGTSMLQTKLSQKLEAHARRLADPRITDINGVNFLGVKYSGRRKHRQKPGIDARGNRQSSVAAAAGSGSDSTTANSRRIKGLRSRDTGGSGSDSNMDASRRTRRVRGNVGDRRAARGANGGGGNGSGGSGDNAHDINAIAAAAAVEAATAIMRSGNDDDDDDGPLWSDGESHTAGNGNIGDVFSDGGGVTNDINDMIDGYTRNISSVSLEASSTSAASIIRTQGTRSGKTLTALKSDEIAKDMDTLRKGLR